MRSAMFRMFLNFGRSHTTRPFTHSTYSTIYYPNHVCIIYVLSTYYLRITSHVAGNAPTPSLVPTGTVTLVRLQHP